MDDWLTMQETQRFSRLQHLLDKSHIYTQFLLQRIEEQNQRDDKKEKRIAKRLENKKEVKENQVGHNFLDASFVNFVIVCVY